MAIRDLLWACPLCGKLDALKPDSDSRDRCGVCGVVYMRGANARIAAVPGTSQLIEKSAAEWSRALPVLGSGQDANDDPLFGPEPVILRVARAVNPIRNGRELLGWAERLGRRSSGEATLNNHAFVLRCGREHRVIPLESITAVQPSSSTLQIASRVAPLVSIRFPQSSVRLWEHRLEARLQRRYHELGMGVITDFHPRIRVRS
jgi:hypothetical protein